MEFALMAAAEQYHIASMLAPQQAPPSTIQVQLDTISIKAEKYMMNLGNGWSTANHRVKVGVRSLGISFPDVVRDPAATMFESSPISVARDLR